MTTNAYIHLFKAKIDKLNKEEQALLKNLLEASRLISDIYAIQFDQKYLGSNFYPHDVTLQELETEAKNNPQILDPYTMVERNTSGKLVAIPYHVKFKKELNPIIKYIREAAKITDDKEFKDYLLARATSLEDGSYENADIVWLESKVFKFNFYIGPAERYNDQLMFKKCAYQAWVGIINEKVTNEATNFKSIIASSQRKAINPSEKIMQHGVLSIRADNTILFSGLISKFMFTGADLPNEPRLVERYGSEATIFLTSLDEKFDNQHYKIYQKVFEKTFQKGYTKEQLRLGTLRNILVHEIAHPLIKYRGNENRLKNLFPVFDEIGAYVIGVKNCGLLLLKDVISQKELEAIMVMFLCRAFTWYEDYQSNKGVVQYVQGYALALNFLFENGAIRVHNGIFWPNFTKFFVCLDELASVFERMLAEGNYQEAKNFLDQYGSLSVFDQFSKK